VDKLLQDLRYGIRALAKAPGFTVVAVLAIALGIGANTAIFSVVDAVLLRPLPFPEPERLMRAFLQEAASGQTSTFGIADFLAWRDHQQSFEHVAAYDTTQGSVALTGLSNPERIRGVAVSADFFSALGATPILGRAFTPEDDRPGSEPVVVIGKNFWRSHLSSDPNVLGRSITLDGRPHIIIGVMPSEFLFPGTEPIAVWPIRTFEPPRARPPYFLVPFGRLKHGITPQQAEAELRTIASQVSQQFPDTQYVVGGKLIPLKDVLVQDVRTALLVMLAAVSFVLLIALVNVANLLLARATSREKEIALRLALGASRMRIIRQLLTESILMASLGGALGLLLGYIGVHAFLAFAPGKIPRLIEVGVDGRVLAFTCLVSILGGILFGLAPALHSTRASLNDSLKEGTRSAGSASGNKIRKFLVVSEFALALVLMIGAGLLIRSFLRLRGVNPGFQQGHLVTAQISLPRTPYEQEPQIISFWQQFLARVQALPGVQAAGITMSLPPNLLQITNPFIVEGQGYDRNRALQLAEELTISPDYFGALGVPLLKGRFFTDSDRTVEVLIINETMAKKYFANQDPIGKRIQTGDPDPKSPWETVVGVVGDVKYSGLEAAPSPTLYVPYTEQGWTSWSRNMSLVVRTRMDPVSIVSALRQELAHLDKNLPLSEVHTMNELIDQSVVQQRFRTWLLGAFSALALLLAAVGIYAVISHMVGQRTREIGIRIALGASRKEILKLILGQASQLALVGICVGVTGALLLTRIVRSLLFSVSATDPLSFAMMCALLAFVALLAGYVPATRATRVDPMVALRYE
jgi:putative ABC transport system permease protein